MIIKNIQYKVYGKIQDERLSFSSGLNVIRGFNEAGKTTVSNSISTLIYGFKPANRHKHPYANWKINEIDFSGEVESNGELYWIERRLKSAPKMNIVSKSAQQLRSYTNDVLPFDIKISEMLFTTVFHLTSEHLNQMEQLSWEGIQEKLIFNYGSDYLKSISEVIESLEQEINALWRKDKRGNPLINQLNQEIHLLKEKKHDAERHYELMKRKLKRSQEIDNQLNNALDTRRQYENELKRLRHLLPKKGREIKISEIEASFFKREAFALMNQDLLIELNNCEKQILDNTQKRTKIFEAIEQQKRSLPVLSAHDEKLLSFKHSQMLLIQLLHDWEALEHEENLRMDTLIKLSDRIESQHKLLFGVPITENSKLAIEKLQVLELNTLFQKYLEASNQNKALEKAQALEKAHNHKLYGVLSIMGVLMIFAGMLIEPLYPALFIGVALTSFAISNFRLSKKKYLSEWLDLTTLKTYILEAVNGLELPEYLWEDEDQRFFSRLEQLVLLIFDEVQQNDDWQVIHEKKKAVEQQVKDILNHHGIDSSRGVKLSLQFALSQVDEVEKIKLKRDEQVSLIQSKVEVLENIDQDIKQLNLSCEWLKEQLSEFGDGNFSFGKDVFQHNLNLLGKLSVYLEERRNEPIETEDLNDVSEERIMEIEEQLSQVISLEKVLIAEKTAIESEINQLESRVNIDEINSQIMVLQERLSESLEKRNQLMVLLEVVKFSDMRYRLENQPNLIQRVSHFLKIMTLGKYEEVLVSETNGTLELQFLLGGEIISASKAFSKGTVQQLFLAYRLAVIEALDPEGCLPLILDEALVNFDGYRFEATVKLLNEISEKRQIFYFTCHEHFAKLINELTDCPIIEVI